MSKNAIDGCINLTAVLLTGHSGENEYTSNDFCASQVLGHFSSLPRVLSLRGVDKTTMKSLAEKDGEDLLHLDLAGPLSGHHVLGDFQAQSYPNLRVLSLRGHELVDAHFQRCTSTGHRFRVWSLDLRQNRLTDQILPNLIEQHFPKAHTDYGYVGLQSRHHELPPSYMQQDHRVQELQARACRVPSLRSDTSLGFAASLLANYPYTENGTAPIVDFSGLQLATGLTHLYLGGNYFTENGIYSLLRDSRTLQYLDVGALRNRGETAQLAAPWRISISTHGLGDVLKIENCPHLEHLRIHHSFITRLPTLLDDRGRWSPLPGSQCNVTEQSLPFDPSSTHRLRVLHLIGIPRRFHVDLVTQLTRFLAAAAKQEAVITKLQSQETGRRSIPMLPGLRVLRLEMLPVTCGDEACFTNSSYAEDGDAEAFHRASMADFSFFNEDEMNSNAQQLQDDNAASRKDKIVDVIQALKDWRRSQHVTQRWGGRLEVVHVDVADCDYFRYHELR